VKPAQLDSLPANLRVLIIPAIACRECKGTGCCMPRWRSGTPEATAEPREMFCLCCHAVFVAVDVLETLSDQEIREIREAHA
jgi:hypothetical protein